MTPLTGTPTRTCRVLLVDDDADFLEIHRRPLERAGYEVLVAGGADEAFAVATTHPIDVAVLDVMMSTDDEGFVLARRLRGDPRTAGVPLVMLSSINAVNAARGVPFQFSDRDRDERFLPIDRFVDKPVTGAQLVAIVGELARSRR